MHKQNYLHTYTRFQILLNIRTSHLIACYLDCLCGRICNACEYAINSYSNQGLYYSQTLNSISNEIPTDPN